jgi:hypothetical protein
LQGFLPRCTLGDVETPVLSSTSQGDATHGDDLIFLNVGSGQNRLINNLCRGQSQTIDIIQRSVFPRVEVDDIFIDFAAFPTEHLEIDGLLQGDVSLSAEPVETVDGRSRVVAVLAPVGPSGTQPANLRAELPPIGHVRAEAATTVVAPNDRYYFTSGRALGPISPFTGLADHFQDGMWQHWRGPGGWLTERATRRLVANADLAELVLYYNLPSPTQDDGLGARVVTYDFWDGDTEALQAGGWHLEADSGLGYASMPRRERYRHRVGLIGAQSSFHGMETVELGYLVRDQFRLREVDTEAFLIDGEVVHVPAPDIMETPSQCYGWGELAADFPHLRDHVVGRFDAVELELGPGLPGDGLLGRTVSIDAGTAFLGRLGVVALPDPLEAYDRVETGVDIILDAADGP